MMKSAPQIQLRAVDDLTPYAKNSRTHDKKQIGLIADSIDKFGMVGAIIVRGDTIAKGHGTLEAIKKLLAGGQQIYPAPGRIGGAAPYPTGQIPVIDATGWTDNQFQAFVIADNQIATLAGWDEDILAQELKSLRDDGFDLDVLGLSAADIASLTGGDEAKTDENEVPEPEPVLCSKLGDLWICGGHLVRCGDSTSPADVGDLLGGARADMVFTDPPYNVDYGNNKTNPAHKIRTIKNDAMSEKDWDAFTQAYVQRILDNCDGNIYICMSDAELGHLQMKFKALGGKWASFICWVKDRLVLSAKDYHSRKEQILYGWRDGVKNRQRVEDRTQDDVWEMARPHKSDEHPTMKPVELVERALINSSRAGELILDLFGGSGTTMIACEKNGRVARLMELDPKFVDVIVRRWQNFTGKEAIHAETGLTFDQMNLERNG